MAERKNCRGKYYDPSMDTFSVLNPGSSVSELYTLQVPFTMNMTVCHPGDEKEMLSFISLEPGDTRVSTAGYRDLPTANEPVLHRHDCFELMFVLEGEVMQMIESGCYRYRKGDVCLHGCNTRHSEELTTDFQAVFLMISREYAASLLEGGLSAELSQFFQASLSPKAPPEKEYLDFTGITADACIPAASLLDQIAEEIVSARPGWQWVTRGLMIRFLSELSDKRRYCTSRITLCSSADEFLFQRISHCIEQSGGRISREELSARLHYSGDYLGRIVREHTGQTILAYGRSFWMKEAERLLLTTDRSISDIVRELGYTGRTQFYTLFRQKHGCSPQEYRARNQ